MDPGRHHPEMPPPYAPVWVQTLPQPQEPEEPAARVNTGVDEAEVSNGTPFPYVPHSEILRSVEVGRPPRFYLHPSVVQPVTENVTPGVPPSVSVTEAKKKGPDQKEKETAPAWYCRWALLYYAFIYRVTLGEEDGGSDDIESGAAPKPEPEAAAAAPARATDARFAVVIGAVAVLFGWSVVMAAWCPFAAPSPDFHAWVVAGMVLFGASQLLWNGLLLDAIASFGPRALSAPDLAEVPDDALAVVATVAAAMGSSFVITSCVLNFGPHAAATAASPYWYAFMVAAHTVLGLYGLVITLPFTILVVTTALSVIGGSCILADIFDITR